MSNEIDLVIGGMTCASCAGRVERKLNKLDGVVATVNLATEKAHVSYPDGLEAATLVAEVEAAGYTAAAAHVRARRSRRSRPGPCATASSSSRRWPCP